MTTEEKRKKKNPAGFSEEQLKIILAYCKATRNDPKIPISKIHKENSVYSRTKSTVDTINKAYVENVTSGPILFTNSGIEASLIHDIANPRKFYEKCLKDKSTNLVVLSHGHWPIFWCKQGANTLQYHDSILPNNGKIFGKKIENIIFEEKGKLPIDQYPNRWFEEHWETYHCLKYPRDVSFRKAGKRLGVHWDTAREYYLEVLKQCKVINTFFPLGREIYSPLLVTFKTDYETGLIKGLKTLNRTTYIYKTDNTIILYLFIRPLPKAQNHFTERFELLQERGLISELHISTPYRWERLF